MSPLPTPTPFGPHLNRVETAVLRVVAPLCGQIWPLPGQRTSWRGDVLKVAAAVAGAGLLTWHPHETVSSAAMRAPLWALEFVGGLWFMLVGWAVQGRIRMSGWTL